MTMQLFNRKILVKQDDGRQFIDVVEDETHLSWTSTVDETLQQRNVDAVITRLADGVFNLNWSGLRGAMSETMDFNRHTLVGVRFDSEKGPQRFTGSVQLLNDDGTPDLSPFTNCQVVLAFWNAFFNRHDVSAVTQYVAPEFIQHNPSIADGAEAFTHYYRVLFGPQGSLRESKRTVVSVADRDDLVYLHVIRQDSPTATEMAEVDIFRVRDGQLVEHWAVKQPFPNHSANGHPMF
ncbi:nuclear transport factor 2 family protein [Furfurilactobacillus milii]|uniref:Nuclear transport factor 2 family protein n=1 Tax=Furfurilactobacillus milii TaxID=2888272 RepID=A0ABT6DAK7_9LACO|nr:nuclear transport factor 2 family protein [Furfurilactobacillus milii]MCF6161283.1 nuclear transport factor 2 family protein [Furfurilactobacillus milii]MCF6163663.1 nuclear transport factor 2 family protein [Furfurilactobacillus milii]MCF6418966.1 nuclear transport factor 2 family protein [Furfurilactobacillus milii]MDF9914159.1 nuclear transport factor 2 family protein [Furfurilactobacillus milii]